MQQKTFNFFYAFLLALLGFGVTLMAEDITLTTYYPAPYGAYEAMYSTTLGIGDNDRNSVLGNSGDSPVPATNPGEVWIRGNVGIGTAGPATKLEVIGSATNHVIKSSSVTNGYWAGMFYGSTATNVVLLGDNTNVLRVDTATGGTNSFVVNTAGSVGIGASPGTYKCYINGTGYLNAAAWIYSSDMQLKENISYIQSGLNIIEQLKPVKFDYIQGEKKQAGFIAQEVEVVLPDIVTKGPDGMLGMKTDSIIPYLVKAIQEQQREIEALKAKLDTR